jgi:heat-inducible transcriptional repressor
MTNTLEVPDLNARAHSILKALVESYIQAGQPVGSKTIAQQSGLSLSPATIRNVMADLESMGCIVAPHKSAGRVPTSLGYRLFINGMVAIQPLVKSELQQLKGGLSPYTDLGSLVKSASHVLSGMTQLAGIVSIPKQDSLTIKHLDFVRLSARRILVVMLMDGDEVQNRIVSFNRDLSVDELQYAANFLNKIIVGKDMEQAKTYLVTAMQQDRQALNQMMQSAIHLGEQALSANNEKVSQASCLVSGESNLIGHDDLADMKQLRQLFTAFNQKQEILSLLNRCIQADGVQIFIGNESGYSVFKNCSVVTAPYSINGQAIGVLGVIGPKRMNYKRVIPAVDVTAKLLSSALNNGA